ncbi:MAG: hypothetical protein ACI841_001371 [Planctomycetota bacterium]|jgi:hypothetical protein
MLALVSGAYHLIASWEACPITGKSGNGYRWSVVSLWGPVFASPLGVFLIAKATVLWNRIFLDMLRIAGTLHSEIQAPTQREHS